ncbi:MAG: hypothetical protein P8L85_10460, partial [Rubripirellula sp.]|nr:hypothetical protein [Rubripirellula sp.]
MNRQIGGGFQTQDQADSGHRFAEEILTVIEAVIDLITEDDRRFLEGWVDSQTGIQFGLRNRFDAGGR